MTVLPGSRKYHVGRGYDPKTGQATVTRKMEEREGTLWEASKGTVLSSPRHSAGKGLEQEHAGHSAGNSAVERAEVRLEAQAFQAV